MSLAGVGPEGHCSVKFHVQGLGPGFPVQGHPMSRGGAWGEGDSLYGGFQFIMGNSNMGPRCGQND